MYNLCFLAISLSPLSSGVPFKNYTSPKQHCVIKKKIKVYISFYIVLLQEVES